MKNLSYIKSTSNKITVKGILSDGGTMITYEDADHNEQTVPVVKYLNAFDGQLVTFALATKIDEDLSDELEED